VSKVKQSARDRILNAASKLFQERGYTAVGINEIIATSGTAKATFYSNFASKELLGEAWLKQIHENSEVRHSSMIESGEVARVILVNYFNQLETFLKEGMFRGCPFTNTKAVITSDETLLDKKVIEHKDSIRRFFRSLAKMSGITPDIAEDLGDQIFIIYSGATTEAQNLKQIWPVHIARRTSLKLWDLVH